MRKFLVDEELNWNKWCEIFQSIQFFKPLIKQIFVIHELGNELEIKNLTPGTNAVFKVNNYVVKIFVPENAAAWGFSDYENELHYMKYAISLKVPTPNILANGCIHDRYDFFYIVMDYIDAQDAGRVISDYSIEQKKICGKD